MPQLLDRPRAAAFPDANTLAPSPAPEPKLSSTIGTSASTVRELILSSATGDHLIVRMKGDPPSWFMSALIEIQGLLRLGSGWDSYSARPISVRAAEGALTLLTRTMQPVTPEPSIVPMARGGIQLEWHLRDMNIEVTVPPQGLAEAWYEDLRTGVEREFRFDQGPGELVRVLDDLTRRR
jgi:hypothetical protein